MPINSTQYLSQLPIEKIKAIHKKIPNPLMIVGVLIGTVAALYYTFTKHTGATSPETLGALIGAAAIFVIANIGISIFTLVKQLKVNKMLATLATEHSLPVKGLQKEFRKNLKHISRDLSVTKVL